MLGDAAGTLLSTFNGHRTVFESSNFSADLQKWVSQAQLSKELAEQHWIAKFDLAIC